MAKKLKSKRINPKDYPTLNLVSETEIATDFAKKVYQKFDKLIKCVVLFGSTTKKTTSSGSDIDLILLVDDASVKFDQELIGWYREELGKIIASNPYKQELHINTIKLTTWWQDLLRGDPILLNIIRYGEEIIDSGGFFRPIKILLQEGKLKHTPEAIYTALQRAPMHLMNSKRAELGAIEGVYWTMVDSSQALLMAAKLPAQSPEQIAQLLKENFVAKGLLEDKYVLWYQETHLLYKSIVHGQVHQVPGKTIDEMQQKAEKFLGVMAELIKNII